MSSKTTSESEFEKSRFYISPHQFNVHVGEEDFIGNGAFGSVYRCYHKKHGQVAIKMFNIRGSRSSIGDVFSAVKGEMEIMLLLQKSPQVVGVFGVTRVGFCMFGLVMDYLPRGSLFDLVSECNKLKETVPWCLMLRIMHETAAGLAYLHNARFDERVTHNDLKPENILLDGGFHAKLCDFGGSNLAAHTSCRKNRSDLRRSSDSDVFTINYAAPEYLTTESVRTRAMDVYSYGMILYFALTRSPPFCKLESSVVIANSERGDRPPFHLQTILDEEIDEKNKDIIRFLAGKMVDCWQQEPATRPQITLVEKDLLAKLECAGQDVIKLAVQKIAAIKPMFHESNSSERVNLKTKCSEIFVSELGIPFDQSYQEERRPLLASWENNIKATNSKNYEFKKEVTEKSVEDTEPKIGQRAPQAIIKATCSNSVIPDRLAIVKMATEIDVSHTESRFQKGDKVHIKTKSGFATCVVENTFS